MAATVDKDMLAHVALQRFGLGGKPGQAKQVVGDPRGALKAEIADTTRCFISDPELPTTQAAIAQSYQEQEAARVARDAGRDDAREMRVARARLDAAPPVSAGMDANAMGGNAPGGMGGNAPGMMGGNAPGGMGGNAAPPVARAAPQVEQVIFRAEAMALVKQAAAAPIGFAERLALFWSNHFCVSVQKGQLVRATAGAMEREAVRPHVLGRFPDMLLAVEKHPAMLFYLDNRQSVGPGSRAGRNRKVGLNENLAREILELHTLGVDGGYTQQDVTSLAKIITGWTFVGINERLGPAGTFVFVAQRHEPGVQPLLGRAYADVGVEQGENALRDLARHPSTARHLARKLASHFLADRPPPALVDRLARRYRDTDGDLQQLAHVLIDSPEMWEVPLAKVRSPLEFMLGATRALQSIPDFGQFMGPINAMGHALYSPPGPNGWPDRFEDWAAPEAWRARLDIAASIGRRLGNAGNPSELAVALYGGALSGETAQAIARAESKQQGLALLLMSPEFNRR